MAYDDDLDELFDDRRAKPPAREASSRAYEAFHPRDQRQLRLCVCPAGQPWEWLPYGFLQRIVTEADTGTRVALIWAYAVVMIEGRNLQELDYALANEQVDVIRAFDPSRYDLPADKAAPFITKITVHVHATPADAATLPEDGRRH